MAGQTNATDFTVSTSSTTQNDGNTLDGADTLTINSGASIDTTGAANTDAVSATGGTNTVTNNGTLSAAGTGSAVTFAGSSSSLINTGIVQTTGDNGPAVVFNSFTGGLTNSGSILTFGTNAHGVEINQATAEINSSGRIVVTGTGADAVVFNAATQNMTNSGLISSTDGAAIQFNGAEISLTLNAPSFIVGDIILAATNGVTINTGQSQSNLWTFGGDPVDSWTVNGDVPFVISGTQFASVDPTQFVAAYTELSDYGDAVGTVIGNRVFSLTGLGNEGASTSRRSSKYLPVETEPPVTTANEPRQWAAAIGSLSSHSGSGSLLSYGTAFAGLALGKDRFINSNLLLGIVGGVSQSRYTTAATFSHSQTIDATGANFGLYGSRQMGRGYLDFSIIGSTKAHNSQRTVNNNLVAGGTQIATGNYNSAHISPTVALHRSFASGSNFTITPSAQLRYTAGWVGGYTETGSSANLTLSARALNLIEGQAQVELLRQFAKTSVSTTIGVSNQSTLGGHTVSGTLLASPLTYATGTGGSSLSGYWSMKVTRQFNDRMLGSVSAGSSAGSVGSTEIKGKATLDFSF